MNHSQDDDYLVENLLLHTWQPVAAIAAHAKIHSHTVQAVIQRRAVQWNLEIAKCRVDGHNLVTLIRKRRPSLTMMVMGVTLPIKDDSLEVDV